MNTAIWWHYFIWILAAGILGLALTLIFADRLQLPRRVFLIPYVGLAGGFVAAYLAWSDAAITTLLTDNWVWGVVAAVLQGPDTTLQLPPHRTGFRQTLDFEMRRRF